MLFTNTTRKNEKAIFWVSALAMLSGAASCSKQTANEPTPQQTSVPAFQNQNTKLASKPKVSWHFGIGMNIGRVSRNCFGVGVCAIKAIFVEVDWTNQQRVSANIAIDQTNQTVTAQILQHASDLMNEPEYDGYMHISRGDEGIDIDPHVLSDAGLKSISLLPGDYPFYLDNNGVLTVKLDATMQ